MLPRNKLIAGLAVHVGLECGRWREGIEGATSSTGRLVFVEVGVMMVLCLFFVWNGLVLRDGGVLYAFMWLV